MGAFAGKVILRQQSQGINLAAKRSLSFLPLTWPLPAVALRRNRSSRYLATGAMFVGGRVTKDTKTASRQSQIPNSGPNPHFWSKALAKNTVVYLGAATRKVNPTHFLGMPRESRTATFVPQSLSFQCCLLELNYQAEPFWMPRPTFG